MIAVLICIRIFVFKYLNQQKLFELPQRLHTLDVLVTITFTPFLCELFTPSSQSLVRILKAYECSGICIAKPYANLLNA